MLNLNTQTIVKVGKFVGLGLSVAGMVITSIVTSKDTGLKITEAAKEAVENLNK